MFTLIKTITTHNYSPEFFQDKILINNNNYKVIFGEKAKGITESNKKRIVKISFEGGKNKICRQVVGGSNLGINKNEAYMTLQSVYELDNPNKSNEIIVTAGNKYLYELLFLWFHPALTVRLIFKVGYNRDRFNNSLYSMLKYCINVLKTENFNIVY